MFTQAVCEKILYYVYYLIDPRNGATFYVGKGKGNRVFQHAMGFSEGKPKSEKISLILEILEAGLEVQYIILRHGLIEKEAFEIESAMIDYIGLDILTNQVNGYEAEDRGKMSPQEIIAIYNAEEVEINEPVIAININRLYKRGMSPDKLYDSTRSAWKMSRRREKAKLVLSIYRGIIREVYQVKRWNKKQLTNGTIRWEFEGRVADNDIRNKYLAKSISKYIKHGAKNPIKYINC